MPTILVINPNTSQSITSALRQSISESPPLGFDIAYFTPISGVPSINDEATAAQSRDACISELQNTEILKSAAGVIICCFSDHPLINALSEYTSAPVIGMFHAGISSGLLYKGDFGILATGTGVKHGHIKAIPEMLGGQSTRYTGSFTTGLGVVELQEGDPDRVRRLMQETTVKAVDQGARTLLLGCAGMSGMEELVKEAARTRGVEVKVIDAARAGVGILATLTSIG